MKATKSNVITGFVENGKTNGIKEKYKKKKGDVFEGVIRLTISYPCKCRDANDTVQSSKQYWAANAAASRQRLHPPGVAIKRHGTQVAEAPLDLLMGLTTSNGLACS